MTHRGGKIPEITPDELTDRLGDESDPKAIKRLVAALAYLDGRSPAAISRTFGWPEQTIYSWLDRIEAEGLEAGLYDDRPPGRPAALEADEIEQFLAAVRGPPAAAGIDAPGWSPALAQRYLRREFDHRYSRRHVRRLLNRAGVSWDPAGP